MRRLASASLILPLLLAGCGGSNSKSGSSDYKFDENATVGPRVTIAWPARARDFAAPGYATAARIVFPSAGENGTDFSTVVTRPQGTDAVVQTYQTDVGIHPGRRLLRVDFLADATSSVVLATAAVNVQVRNDGTIRTNDGKALGTVAYGTRIASLYLNDSTPDGEDIVAEVGLATTLFVTAQNDAGAYVAFPTDSVSFAVATGGDRLRADAGGTVTGLAEGVATVVASVDGVKSAPLSVNVLPAPLPSRSVSIVTSDLAVDSVRNRVFVTVPQENVLRTIDGATGAVGASIEVGADPNVLALSDDGSRLYVGLRGTFQIRSLDLATDTLGAPFSSSVGEYGTTYALGIDVQPGRPGTIAVIAQSPDAVRSLGPIVFDEGVARPNAGDFSTGDRPYWGSPNLLYAYGLSGGAYVFAVDEQGATRTSFLSGSADTGLLVRSGTRAYSQGGGIFDAVTLERIGTFPLASSSSTGSPSSPPVIDPVAKRAYFLTFAGRTARLRVFDTESLLETGSRRIADVDLDVPSGQSASLAPRLSRLGAKGLVFRLNDRVVFLDDVSTL